MLPRSKRHAEIMGFLRRPQLLQPKFTLDTDLEEYKKSIKKHNLYQFVAQYYIHSGIINEINNSRHTNFFLDIHNSVKNSGYTNSTHVKILKMYNILKKSEMYDESVCKMGLVSVNAHEQYLGIHFPVIFLQEVNTDREPIELRDLYFYITNSSLHVFRTTLDVVNKDFIHPHVSGNFGNFCTGDSPLKMSLNNLHYNIDAIAQDDADIFWVNLYRTITQKTEIGDHYYALSRLNQGITFTYTELLDRVYNDEEFLTKVTNYISVTMSNEAIEVSFDKDALKKDFFKLFSTESSEQEKKEENLERNVKFNNIALKKKKYIPLYKRSRTMIKNIDSLLDQLLMDCVPTSFINNTYDDYKKTTEESNNSGEQSTGQNQVFEFQML
jgi:hypothetical protein